MDEDILEKIITITGLTVMGMCVAWLLYENYQMHQLSKAGQQFLNEQRDKFVEYDIGRRIDE